MKEKVDISKYIKEKCGKGWTKELLLSFLGTTFSIVLTFGTAQYFEAQKQKADARLLAMMAIHDMDNTVEQLRKWQSEEYENSDIIRSIIENIDTVDVMDYYTLSELQRYLIATSKSDENYPLDESSEKVFLSSQDSWKTINNASFIDAVQKFYVERHRIFNNLNGMLEFEKPISRAEYREMMLGDEKDEISYKVWMKEFLQSKPVMLYIDNTSERQTYLDNYAYSCEKLANACKFAMGITDQDLYEYVKSQETKGRKMEDKDLVGKWIMRNTQNVFESVEYLADHSYKYYFDSYVKDRDCKGTLVVHLTCTGTWELRGDSLIETINSDYITKIDDTNFLAKPGKEKWRDEFVVNEKQLYDETTERLNKNDKSTAYAASIDKSGTKFELVKTYIDDDGQEYNHVTYYTKSDDNLKKK